MHSIRVKKLWTGRGKPLENAVLSIDRGGCVSGAVQGDTSEPFHHPFAMPAFFDAHCHFSWMVLKELSMDLSAAASGKDLLGIVREGIRLGGKGVLRGDSFDESFWRDSKLPALSELNAVTGKRPVFLCRVCGHAGMANSAMMALMENDPRWIDRSTGMVREKPVMEFSRNFPPDPQKAREAVSAVAGKIHAAGVTGICTIEKPADAANLLNAAPELDVRIVCNDDSADHGELHCPDSTMAKLFLDGSFGAGNAAVNPDSSESLLYTDDALLDKLLEYGGGGITPVVHAIGAAALQQLDRVSAEAYRLLGKGFPIRIEHAEDLDRFWPGTWNPLFHIFSMQPNFVERWQRPGGMYDKLLSPERSVRLNPFRSILDRGFSLGFGSDSMPLDPLYGLKGAVRHRDPSLSLTVEESLLAYTLKAAEISGCNQLARPLEPGRKADIVCLSGDPFSGLEGVAVERTLRMGKTVYRSGGGARE